MTVHCNHLFSVSALGGILLTVLLAGCPAATDALSNGDPTDTNPAADAGDDQDVAGGESVTLDGSASSDPDGDTLAFSWLQTAGIDVDLTDADTDSPRFTAPSTTGTLTFQLTVEDGKGGMNSDTVDVRVTAPGGNQAPTATAGADQNVNGGDPVGLDGSASSDPDGDTLTFVWAQTGGTNVNLTGVDTASPTFQAPNVSETLTFQLTVGDGKGEIDTDTVVVEVTALTGNIAPMANAGADRTVDGGNAVTLDGSASSDADGNTLTFVWVQTAGVDVNLTGADTASPSFRAPNVTGTLTFQLTVDDGMGASDTDSVDVGVTAVAGNLAPNANAGVDQTVNSGKHVILSGLASNDPDGDPLTYAWVQTAGVDVNLTGGDTASPAFQAPNTAGILTFELTVNDGNGGIDTDIVDVRVNVVEGNRAPTANAGADSSVNGGDTATLDGSASHDQDTDTLVFAWVQTAGSAVVLSGSNKATASFGAPNVTGTLRFQLTVDDGRGGTDTDTVEVGVTAVAGNVPPHADAGSDQNVPVGDVVSLDGSGSSDADGDVLGFAWTQTAGSAVSLSGTSTARPTFTAPNAAGLLTFRLTVNDGKGGSDTDTVTVNVKAVVVNRPPKSNAGVDQSVKGGTLVTLNGSGSGDPDGDPLTYSWVQTAGTAASLSGASTVSASFRAANVTETLTFRLTVNDGKGGTSNDTVNVSVSAMSQILFIANSEGNHISAYRNPMGVSGNVTPGSSLGGSQTGLDSPSEVVVNASGALLVSNFNTNVVTVYDDAANVNGDLVPDRALQGNETGLNGPTTMALNAAKDLLFVANALQGTDEILVFSSASTTGFGGNAAPVRTITSDSLNGAFGMTVDGADSLYVANHGGNNVLVFANAGALDGNVAPSRILSGDAMDNVFDVIVDLDDNLYVVNASGSVLRFRDASKRGGIVTPDAVVTVVGSSFLTGITMDAAGTAYLADNSADAIYAYERMSSRSGVQPPDRVIQGLGTGLVGPVRVFLWEE